MDPETDGANALRDFLGDEDISGAGDLNEINSRELVQGEKANDAEDYEDIDDDDLADEDDQAGNAALNTSIFNGPQFEDADDDDDDDLFGEAPDSRDPFVDGEDTLLDESLPVQETTEDQTVVEDETEEEDDETREQRLLFEAARSRLHREREADESPPPPPTDDELFSTIWPQFEPDRPPRFGELLPQKKAHYVGKAPLRPPKPIHPTKVNLELEPDQEKAFRLPAGPTLPFELRQLEAEARGIVLLPQELAEEESGEDEDDFGLLEEEEGVGGISWQDLVTVCEDWDLPSQDNVSVDEEAILERDPNLDDLFLEEDFDTLESPRPAKRRKLGEQSAEPLRVLHNLNTAFEDPEKATSRLARKVNLDLNDPHLLIDLQDPAIAAPKKRTIGSGMKRDTAGGLTKSLTARYNISNDEAYDLLKQNHQNKIRSQVGNTPLEHAGPASRLQYPFYKQDLTTKDRRNWHRPLLHVTPGDVWFKKPASHKRKMMRGKDPQELFFRSGDLTVGDNSSVLLLEYSEEHPAMLSSFGMGNRLINYYRRKDAEDTSRPRLDIGETSVLLPQDKSPFDRFGDVDKGQVMPTLSNSMFRAPVFKHEPKAQDFLVSRSSTGLGGSTYCLRNIENLHAVGQEFPYVAVPGPKARAATNVGKHRLYMVSYRMYNKRGGKLTMDDVKRHNPETDLPTIRTKMKEFMDFDKSAGQGRGIWKSKKEPPPDEGEIRSMVKPDDVVALYAMQVGQQHLRDSGFTRQGDDELEDEDNEDADTSAGNLDQQLTPWHTTKNFLVSCKGGAMLEVHGEGDPSGRGEALSMIRTSMKGGFRAIGQSIEDRLNNQKQKDQGGHKYNVARQNQEYAGAIRRVWEAQARALSSNDQHDDVDMGGVEDAPRTSRAGTPGSGAARRNDESASRFSAGSGLEHSGRVLKITRNTVDKYGNQDTHSEVIRDPRIIREYQKRARERELAAKR